MNKVIDSGVVWCDRDQFHSEAATFIKPVSTVLDIGCGIRPQQYITPEYLICVEPHLEYVEILKTSLKDANAVIIPLDALKALAGMPDRSIDSIFLIDVIEHMEKDIGAKVLLECERVARQQVIIFTPLGFMPQEIHAGDVDGWNLHGGEWQDHKSGWYPEEFPGWEIIGCKHLHLHDYLGQEINPPYGGFYAVKNIKKVANHFNDIYSNDVIGSQVSNLPWLREQFPLFGEKVVARDIAASHLKCGISSCQRTTELFIELGATESPDVIFSMAAQEKSDALSRETRKHSERIKEFADQFSRLANFSSSVAELDIGAAELNEKASLINQKEGDLLGKEGELLAKEGELLAKEAELLEKEGELLAKEADLTSRLSQFSEKQLEADQRAEHLNALEKGITDSLCGKVSRKIRALFK